MARSEEDCLAHMLAAARRAISLLDAHTRAIAVTRDRLIHGYFAVDLDIVWQIVKNDLPPVVDALRTMVPLEGAPDV